MERDSSSIEKDVSMHEELARISPRCVRFSTNKTMWRVMFLALFSSVATYYGIFQLLVPYIIDVLDMSELILVFVAISLVLIYVLVLFFSIRYQVFGAVNLLILYGTLFFVSSTGILVSVANLLPFQGFEILKLFVVVLVFNSIMIFVSFYVTRMVVCRVKDVEKRDLEIRG